MSFLGSIGELFTDLGGIFEWIKSTFDSIAGVFSDVDFTLLYSWLPSDIQSVITSVLVVLLFLALFGVLRRVLFFLG